MKHAVTLLSALLLAPPAALDGADMPTPAPAGRPNIVLFLIDDLGWRDLGCQGSTFYQTPNIDRLALEGARFTDAYSACAVCSPTRAAVLTGKYPARLLLTDWLPSGRWNPQARLQSGRFVRALPLEEHTLAEALREAGYRTASIGKWHLGSEPFSLPEHHGFEVNIAGNGHGAPGNYFFPYDGDWKIPTTDLRATWNVLSDGKPGEYLTDRLTDEALKFIHDHRDRPFFLYFPHYGVHTPLQAKPEMIAKYESIPEAERQGKPVYAAMVESVDQSVGRVLATLTELGLEKRTVVIFTSDNGGFYNATSNAPLRANKGAYYEGGIRVPLLIKWPSVTKPGGVISEPVTSSDLYPTCLAAAGLPLRPHQHSDGLNLQPLFTGAASLGRRSLFWHFPHYNEHPSSVPSSVIRRGPWKLIETFDPEGKGAACEAADVPDDGYPDGRLAQLTVETLGKLKEDGQSFFLAVGFFKPHLPFNAPQKYWDLYDPAVFALADGQMRVKGAPEIAYHTHRELGGYQDMPEDEHVSAEQAHRLRHGYYACVSYVDAQVGKLLDALHRLGLDQNTIVVLWGDHGWSLGEKDRWCKGTNFERDTRVPLLIRTPGLVKPGVSTDALLEYVDIYPTLAALAGLTPPADLDGKSFVPVLEDPAARGREWRSASSPGRGRRPPSMPWAIRCAPRRSATPAGSNGHRRLSWPKSSTITARQPAPLGTPGC